jgi:hypothetical protein
MSLLKVEPQLYYYERDKLILLDAPESLNAVLRHVLYSNRLILTIRLERAKFWAHEDDKLFVCNTFSSSLFSVTVRLRRSTCCDSVTRSLQNRGFSVRPSVSWHSGNEARTWKTSFYWLQVNTFIMIAVKGLGTPTHSRVFLYLYY